MKQFMVTRLDVSVPAPKGLPCGLYGSRDEAVFWTVNQLVPEWVRGMLATPGGPGSFQAMDESWEALLRPYRLWTTDTGMPADEDLSPAGTGSAAFLRPEWADDELAARVLERESKGKGGA